MISTSVTSKRIKHRRPAKWLRQGTEWGRSEPPMVDLQMHTVWTDGRSTCAEMIDAAKTAGLQAIAITEHINFQSTYYDDFVKQVKHLRRRESQLEIYYGVEAAAVDYEGNLKTTLDVQKHAEWALGVVHAYPKENTNSSGEPSFYRFDELTADHALQLELRALEGLAAHAPIDVLGHPGGTYYRKFGPFPVERMATAFTLAKEYGVAVELNTRYCWDPSGMIDLLRSINPLVSFGSDAHNAADVGANLTAARQWQPIGVR